MCRVLTRTLSAGGMVFLSHLTSYFSCLSSKNRTSHRALQWLWLPRAAGSRHMRLLIPDTGFLWGWWKCSDVIIMVLVTQLWKITEIHWHLKGKFKSYMNYIRDFNAFFQEVFLVAHSLCQETLIATEAGPIVLRNNWVTQTGSGNCGQGCGRTASSVENSKAAKSCPHFRCRALRVLNKAIDKIHFPSKEGNSGQ